MEWSTLSLFDRALLFSLFKSVLLLILHFFSFLPCFSSRHTCHDVQYQSVLHLSKRLKKKVRCFLSCKVKQSLRHLRQTCPPYDSVWRLRVSKERDMAGRVCERQEGGLWAQGCYLCAHLFNICWRKTCGSYRSKTIFCLQQSIAPPPLSEPPQRRRAFGLRSHGRTGCTLSSH